MNIEQEKEIIQRPWQDSPYYKHAERWIHLFWGKDSLFQSFFDHLDLSNTVELACGYGRHSERVAPRAGQLILVDVFQTNLEQCRIRLAAYQNISYLLGNGYNFQPIPDSSITAIFSYDAMVHFSMNVMLRYLQDSARILKPGGMAQYHHSNFPGPGAAHYGQNPHARNVMDFSLFSRMAEEYGLKIVDSLEIDWGGIRNLDRLTLLKKK
jgi:ubiquinone/menaquinone biosynthesis C-methylase UbiE